MDEGAWWATVHGVTKLDTTEHTAQAFDCVDHNKLRKILKEMGIPDHLTCLVRNLYAGQEVTVMEKEMATHSLPGESQGRRSLVGSRLWGRTESDTTETT